MKQVEMGKFMLWMLGIFPQWKPDPAVAATWAGELPDMSADAAKDLVRKLQARKPSPFPPSVFEIMAETRPAKRSGHEVFKKILNYIKGVYAGNLSDYFDAKELKAIERIGGMGAIRNSRTDDPFFLKSFICIWNEVQEEANVLSVESPKALQIGAAR